MDQSSSKGGIRRSNSHTSLGSRNSYGGGGGARRSTKGGVFSSKTSRSFGGGGATTSNGRGDKEDTAQSHCETTVVETMDGDVDIDTGNGIDIDADINADLNGGNVDVDLEAQAGENSNATIMPSSSLEDIESSDLPCVRETRSDSESSSSEDGKDKKNSDSNNNRSDSEDDDNVVMIDFTESNQKVYVPLPGQAYHAGGDIEDEKGQQQENNTASASPSTSTTRRLAPSGCTICLCLFEPNERVTWSSNPDCSHIFHSDCLLHWYLAVGRKTAKRRQRQNPDMSNEEMLLNICKFPTLCPTCRQPFCGEIVDTASDDAEGSGGNDDGNEGRHPQAQDIVDENDATPTPTSFQVSETQVTQQERDVVIGNDNVDVE
mmetsp:Transcript_57141/g.139295  ORF Transcript_57141/g.139295 Transcript_57141/m.139295 type:complete len:376 (+) Transcript_57141:102-1229(+)